MLLNEPQAKSARTGVEGRNRPQTRTPCSGRNEERSGSRQRRNASTRQRCGDVSTNTAEGGAAPGEMSQAVMVLAWKPVEGEERGSVLPRRPQAQRR